MRRYFIDAQAMQETDTASKDDRLKTEKVLNQNPLALQELQASSGIRTLILDIQHSASRKLTVTLTVLSLLAIARMSQNNTPHIFRLQLNNRDLPKPRPKGDSPEIFVILKGGPVIEVVHADLTNANFGGRIKRTGEDSRDERLAPVVRETMARSCGRIHTAVARWPRITSVHRRAPRRDDTLLVRVGGKEESE